MRLFRYIEEGHGADSLTEHEIHELKYDFDIDVEDYYVLIPVTKEEFNNIKDK